jgi:hypothetical protein
LILINNVVEGIILSIKSIFSFQCTETQLVNLVVFFCADF